MWLYKPTALMHHSVPTDHVRAIDSSEWWLTLVGKLVCVKEWFDGSDETSTKTVSVLTQLDQLNKPWRAASLGTT